MRVWERLWEIPLVEVHERVSSTNDRLRVLAREGARPFTTVIAEEQTGGRGRSGRSWWSPHGSGLWLSVLLEGEAEGAPPLTPIVVGVAVARAVAATAPDLSPRIRWPNDVLVGGRKVCGILCEGVTGGRVIAGVGINVSQAPDDFPADLRGRAGSLEAAAGTSVSRPRLAGALLEALGDLFRDGPPRRLDGGLGSEVEALDALRGVRVEAGVGVSGRVLGIAPDGALIVEDRQGRRNRILAGSVREEERCSS